MFKFFQAPAARDLPPPSTEHIDAINASIAAYADPDAGVYGMEGSGLTWIMGGATLASSPNSPDDSNIANSLERVSSPINVGRRGFLQAIGAIGLSAAAISMSKDTSASSLNDKQRMEVGAHGMAMYDEEAKKNKFANNPEKGVIINRQEAEAKFTKGEYQYYYPESVIDPTKKSQFQIEREKLSRDTKNGISTLDTKVSVDFKSKNPIIGKTFLTKDEIASMTEVDGNGLIVFAEVVGGKGYAVLPPGTILIKQSIGEYKGSQVILGCMNPIIARAKGNCPPPCVVQE